MSETHKAIRSPSYPSMALPDAVDAISKIERLYRSNPVDRLSAVKLLGYSSLNGPSQKALADLAAYGLLERAGKGDARVTLRARDILHPSGDEDRNANLRSAALEPPLYRELRERFAGIPVPPEDGVIRYLNRLGFNPNAVRPAANAFLATMSYLEEVGVSDSDGIAPPPMDNDSEPDGGSEERRTVDDPTPHYGIRRRAPILPPPPTVSEKVQIMEGERVVFTEEGQPNQYLKLVASGPIDDGLLEALEDFVKRQRRRLEFLNRPAGMAPRPLPGFEPAAPDPDDEN